MDSSQPDKHVLPKVPVPVEESRAQRLQRSQARFRDRGGIFVPTSRNTLVDILLGRKVASPKKRRGRSASLSPKKKSAKSDLRNNDEEVKAVRTSPRKAAQRQEPEAGPSNLRDMVLKHKPTKKSEKQTAIATATSEVKIKGDNEKPATKKRGRIPKTPVDDIEHPDTVDHDPSPPEKSRPTPKKSRIKSVSKKPARLGEYKKDSLIDRPEPKKSAKATSKAVSNADKKSSRASTSKKSSASRRKPTTSIELRPAPLQQSSTGAGSSKTEKELVPDDDPRLNGVQEGSSRENIITKGKGKKKAPQRPSPGDKPDVTAAEALQKPRKKRARPAESEVVCPPPPKRVKQTLSEETKPKARRRKAPTAQQDTAASDELNVVNKNKEVLSKKRAREPDDERSGAKRKKTKGTVDVSLIADEAVDKHVNRSNKSNKGKAGKTKKLPTSMTSRAKKDTIKAPDEAKVPAQTITESGALIIPRIRPRKSVVVRMKVPEPHEIGNNDPDPIDFLC